MTDKCTSSMQTVCPKCDGKGYVWGYDLLSPYPIEIKCSCVDEEGLTMRDSGMEYEMDMESESACERCGSTYGDLTLGYEWDMDYCCASCSDELAWEDEQRQDALLAKDSE